MTSPRPSTSITLLRRHLRDRYLPTRPGHPALRARAMTLIELLVAMGLFAIVSTILLGMAVSLSTFADQTESNADVTEESRLAIERMTREFRQARSLDYARLVDAGSDITEMTISVDFDGSGAIENNAADPEILTYRWDPNSKLLTLSGNDPTGDAVTRPILAGGVTDFELRLRSSLWIYDADGDGITTWAEIDSSPVGNGNGEPDGEELEFIDLISVAITVAQNDAERTFTLQADMRNRPQETVIE